MQIRTITSPTSATNEMMFCVNNNVCYRGSIAQPIKASPSIEHKSAETYPQQRNNPMKAQLTKTYIKDSGKLQPEY